MTIGEKIKFFRTRIGITQAKLAELSGIHPVSIRKYETNKMVPQAPQIDKLAEALGVGSFALSGFENNIKLETVGDFMGLMIMLIKSNILLINGERGENSFYDIETVSFEINPLITKFFDTIIDNEEFSTKDILYTLKRENLLHNLLVWERMNHIYKTGAAIHNSKPTKTTQKGLEILKNNRENIEMKLQCSNVLLDTDDSIAIEKLPIFLE